ncbi:MAG: hypothetical protein E6H10_07715 [Bacteroidetes bacterium]|nr:MAG: hypothetical protein E6H10_07715 [Bacteroidota bacterium]
MRKLHVLLSILSFLTCSIVKAQSVGVNADGSTPDASAMLDVKNPTKGLLIPRVALTATNVAGPVSSPATSLLVYNTVATSGDNGVTPGFYFWNGTAWEKLSTNTWSLNGNKGTDATTNFIGTTDAQALVFKVHNLASGFINETHGNTAFGYSTLSPNISGTANTAIGSGALFANTVGADNTANGYLALGVTTGSDNTGIGNIALQSNTTGSNNTAVGSRALVLNATGSNNTAVGYLADVGFGNLTNATAIGYNAKVHQSNSMVLGDNVNVHWHIFTSHIFYIRAGI